jgi:hypothetical protein
VPDCMPRYAQAGRCAEQEQEPFFRAVRQCPTACLLCFSVVAFSYPVLCSWVCCVLVRYLGVQLREAGRAVLRREPRHGHQGAHGTVQAQSKHTKAKVRQLPPPHETSLSLHPAQTRDTVPTPHRKTTVVSDRTMASLCSINLGMQAEAVLCQPASAFLPVIDEVIYY